MQTTMTPSEQVNLATLTFEFNQLDRKAEKILSARITYINHEMVAWRDCYLAMKAKMAKDFWEANSDLAFRVVRNGYPASWSSAHWLFLHRELTRSMSGEYSYVASH